MTLVIQRLSIGSRKLQEAVILTLGLGLAAFIAYASGYMVYESYIYEEVSYGYIPVPLWIPQLPVAIGALALFFAVLDAWVGSLRGKTPNYMKHEDELSFEE